MGATSAKPPETTKSTRCQVTCGKKRNKRGTSVTHDIWTIGWGSNIKWWRAKVGKELLILRFLLCITFLFLQHFRSLQWVDIKITLSVETSVQLFYWSILNYLCSLNGFWKLSISSELGYFSQGLLLFFSRLVRTGFLTSMLKK